MRAFAKLPVRRTSTRRIWLVSDDANQPFYFRLIEGNSVGLSRAPKGTGYVLPIAVRARHETELVTTLDHL